MVQESDPRSVSALVRRYVARRIRPGLRLVAICCLAWGLLAAFHPDMLIGRQRLSMDFASYYYAAKVSHQSQDFYDPGVLDRSRRQSDDSGRVFPYIYPPFLAQWLRPLGTLSPSRASSVWNHLLMLACAAIAATIVCAGRGRDWVTATALAVFGGLLLTVTDSIRGVGQVTVVLCLLVTLAFVAARRSQDVLAGVLLALAAALKLTPALISVIWLAERRWKALVSFGVTLVGLGAASVAAFGFTPWKLYLQCLQRMSQTGQIPGLAPTAAGCFSPTALFLRLGLSTTTAGQLSFALTCSLLAPIVYLAYQNRNRGSASVALAMNSLVLLASPLNWPRFNGHLGRG